jgi:hypothetical protein
MRSTNIFLLTFGLLFGSCLNSSNVDSIILNEYEKCSEINNCVVDFSNIMKFDWDTMYYFSAANSLEEVNKEIGFELKEFTDIGDRIIFLNKSNLVYHEEWFPNPSEPLKGVVFKTDLKKFKIDRQNARFKVMKEGEALFLEKL